MPRVSVCTVVTVLAVSGVCLGVAAGVTEKILQVPLFEVGQLWVRAGSTLVSRAVATLTTLPDLTAWQTYAVLALLLPLLYYGYQLLLAPMNWVRNLGDIGYVTEGSLGKREMANLVRRRRMVGDIPPVYPNGWFGVCESFLLKKAEVKHVSILGQNLAVFRDESGTAHVLDAYCPHLGASLAVGGRVFGDCLECPFHAWRFRGADGKCMHIPYTDKIPDMARVKSWPVMEVNGWIYLWHHAEGIEPNWLPLEMEDITNGNWVYRGRTEHIVNAHIEEIPENGADVVHLHQVHTPAIGAGIDLRFMWSKLWGFAHHNWTARWEAQPEPNQHIGCLTLTHALSTCGLHLPLLDLNVKGKQIGPGIVHLEFESLFGRGVFIQSLTPVEPMVQKMVHNIYAVWYMPPPIAKFFLLGEAIQVERDIMIWNNMRYQGKPLLVKSEEDSLIARHRRWFSQFYSENSPRLSFARDTMEW